MVCGSGAGCLIGARSEGRSLLYLEEVVLRGGSSKDDTVLTRKKWQVVARLRNKEGRPAKAGVFFRFETVLAAEGAAIYRRRNSGAWG